MERLQVSPSGHFLVTESGRPFFWLGDTAWELFHRSTREEAARYLENRRLKGFSVIQAVVLAELDGLHTANRYGHVPLLGNDPTRPNEAYFQYVDDVVRMAQAQGLYVGLLPTWGDKVTPLWGVGPLVFDEQNARAYGHFLGQRYRDQPNLVWILGGDRPAVAGEADYRPVWRAMAAGIDEATGGVTLVTYHPSGGNSTSAWLHDEPWLDVNMMQSGHGAGRDTPVWDRIAHDYSLKPVKPTLDGEPNYEDHPVSPWPTWNPANGYFRDYDVRKQLYRSVFAGGCGVTYGHHSIWQMFEPGRSPITYPERDWTEALDRPGACQVQHLRRLMESRPFLTRIPDQGLLLSDPGAGAQHGQATRDAGGSYAFVYVPQASQSVEVDLRLVSGRRVKAWWYDPRTGAVSLLGEFDRAGPRRFTTPGAGPDWVLVLDDAARPFVAPGQSE